MTRILGIDYGKARIGLALSDERRFLASTLPCIQAGKTAEENAHLIAKESAKYGPLISIVMGLPLHLSGRESPLSEEVRQVAQLLEGLLQDIPMILWDERLSTAQVEKTLKEMGVSRKKRSAKVDSQSAALILQSFLDVH